MRQVGRGSNGVMLGRYSAIRHLPLAKDLVRASRQQLVAHLDAYSKRHRGLFEKVILKPLLCS